MVWKKITELVTSPGWLMKQAERWLNTQKNGINTSIINIGETEKEITKLKAQEDRFAKAYGAGVITIEQLKEYVAPIKEKILSLEIQITKAQVSTIGSNNLEIPKLSQVEVFVQKVSQEIDNLNFKAKKAIIRSIIDRVVGTREQLQFYGYIPVTDINVFTEHRNCRFAKRGKIHAF